MSDACHLSHIKKIIEDLRIALNNHQRNNSINSIESLKIKLAAAIYDLTSEELDQVLS